MMIKLLQKKKSSKEVFIDQASIKAREQYSLDRAKQSPLQHMHYACTTGWYR